MEEIWKDIEGYENRYQVSNLGRVKSLKRSVKSSNQYDGFNLIRKETILKHAQSGGGYDIISIYKNGKRSTPKVHILVWEAFGYKKRDGRKIQVDHIDNNKSNNCINNLQLLTPRENAIKSIPNAKTGLRGAYKQKNKFRSAISVNGKHKYLGLHSTAIDANNAYQTELNNIK